MLVDKDREHLNAVIRAVSDKAQRIEQLNKMRLESPILYDIPLQAEMLDETIRLSRELKEKVDEMIKVLELDRNEQLDIYKVAYTEKVQSPVGGIKRAPFDPPEPPR